MTEEEYKNLKVGDKIYHRVTGEVTISRIYTSINWEKWESLDRTGRPEDFSYTDSFETDDGRYSKIFDADVKDMRKRE